MNENTEPAIHAAVSSALGTLSAEELHRLSMEPWAQYSALGSHMREQFDRMRENAIAELTEILGEPVHLDEHGAIILSADQRARLLEAVPAVHEQPPGFHFETAWGVPIAKAEEVER